MARRNGGTAKNTEEDSTAFREDGGQAVDESAPHSRGNIGQQIYDQVEELVAKEGITRSAAFARISEETGRQAGAVSTNYYRVARQHGKGRGPRRAGKATAGASRARGRTRRTSGPTAVVRDAQQALTDVAKALRHQEAEIAKLRAENEDFAQLRRMINAQKSGSPRKRRG